MIFMRKLKVITVSLAFLLTLSITTAHSMPEKQWQQKQKQVVKVVQKLIRLGTRYPAYRCGIYVPGVGVCYMKMTSVNMPASGDPKFGGVPAPFNADVAEVLMVAREIGKSGILREGESLVYQSRFLNTIYLRIIPYRVVKNIKAVQESNLLIHQKLIEDIVTYKDGSYEGEKYDVWISMVTERFSRGVLPVQRVPGEGVIIPDQAIVLYNRFPHLWKTKGEKSVADKLFEAVKEAQGLEDYYPDYKIAVALESGLKVYFAKYTIKDVKNLDRKSFKYYVYEHKIQKSKNNDKDENKNN